MKRWLNFKKQSLTTFDIALAGVFCAVIIVAKSPFLTLNFGIMRVSTVYIWFILIGLIFRPLLGITIGIVGDTLAMVVWGQIGFWHWSYFIIPILIYLITFFAKKLYDVNSQRILLLGGLIVFLIMNIAIILTMLLAHNFTNKTSGDEAIDLTNLTTKFLLWTMFGTLIIYQLIIFYVYTQKKATFWKHFYVTNLIIILVIVLVIWLYGPFANVLWLSTIGGKKAGTNYYWSVYSLYQIPRIIKTPIILPLYLIIIIPLNRILQLQKKSYQGW